MKLRTVSEAPVLLRKKTKQVELCYICSQHPESQTMGAT